jgi:hypothetical protein
MCLLGCACSLPLRSACQGAAVHVVTAFLKPVAGAEVSLSRKSTKMTVSTDRNGTVCMTGTFYGEHMLEVRANGFAIYKHSILLHPYGDSFAAVLSVARLADVKPLVLTGKVIGRSHDSGRLWVHLSHVLGSDSMSAPVNQDRTFAITGEFVGFYMLQLVAPSGIVACKQIEFQESDLHVEMNAGRQCCR